MLQLLLRAHVAFLTLGCIAHGDTPKSMHHENSLRGLQLISEVDSPFETIQIKCPAENSGILEYLRKNREGYVRKLRYKFVNGKAKKYIIELAEPGKGFKVESIFDADNPGDAQQTSLGNRNISETSNIVANYCNSLESRPLFDAMMNESRRRLSDY